MRPAFAKDFPSDPALDALVDAFARGNYGAVRDGARGLAREADSDATRRAARDLLARTEPDPLARLLVALTGALLAFLTLYWALQHPPAPATPEPRGAAERIR